MAATTSFGAALGMMEDRAFSKRRLHIAKGVFSAGEQDVDDLGLFARQAAQAQKRLGLRARSQARDEMPEVMGAAAVPALNAAQGINRLVASALLTGYGIDRVAAPGGLAVRPDVANLFQVGAQG